ncbi:sorbosone dehydrogenase family protein [Nocardioides sp.]|uniref:PQQ-dependent sugar dehydrogenase n=1 Tax=Nocardioides sp. TaxID=35761 RepID=UPI003516FD96
MRTRLALAVLALGVPLVSAPLVTADTAGADAAAPTAAVDRAAPPALRVRTLASGLSHAWDVVAMPDGALLMTERNPARLSVVRGTQRTTVAFPTRRIWAEGETGLMGLALDTDFAENRRFYTCSGWRRGAAEGGGHDVRVNAWTLSADATRARLVGPLVSGFPTTTGRHGGCRLLIAENGALIVGTGDAAQGRNPRDKDSLGGKTLRLDPRTGKPWATNPFIGSSNPNRRYVHTYGHRNVQGLAQREDGTLWSVEHGPDRDDEVNKLRPGGDYGWNPVPGYNESVPMTDRSLPGPQVGARWSTGVPTLATSGADFVRGSRWGAWSGALAVATLKAEKVVLLRFDARGAFLGKTVPPALDGRFGRLRTVRALPGGDLLVCTDGEGDGRLLRVSPVSPS